jgi:GAF domain-containing protein
LKSVGEAAGFEAKNLIAVPILIRGKVYGILELLNRIGNAEYTPKDIEMMNYLCQVASKVIEARLMMGWTQKKP